MSRFSLWTEPWIPVQTMPGEVTKVSLSKALTEAHTLRGVVDPSPLVTVALHRLLLAVLYRVHRPRRFADWQAVWKTGRFDSETVLHYGENHVDQFDLLHQVRPFYQVPFQADEKVHPVAALLLEAASGNNPALFDHGRVEGAEAIPLDRAACYLVAHQLFAIGGGVSKPFNRMDAPLTKGIVVEVMGQSLFETLMLNHMTDDFWQDLAPPTPSDRPFWEEVAPPEPRKDGTPVKGPMHYLTWQSRQVHLVADWERRLVTGCQISQRYCLPKDGSRFDPGKCYVSDEKMETGFQPRRLQRDRAAWRLTHLLLQPTTHKQAQPQVIAWLGALRQCEKETGAISIPKAVSLAVSGLTTDPKLAAKIELWRREEINLPVDIVEEPHLVEQVNLLMNTASRVEVLLSRSAEALVWALAERKHQAVARNYLFYGRISEAQMPPSVPAVARGLGVTLRFWSAMEGPFRVALWRLPDSVTDAATAWADALERNAQTSFSFTLESLKATGASWEPLSLIKDGFDSALSLALKGREEV